LEDKGRAEARRYPRFRLEVDITVHSVVGGPMPGHTLEISEVGISALLPVELPVGEFVGLDINLPFGPVSVRAVVRDRNVFRHGFEFVQPIPAQDLITRYCSRLTRFD
jgi:hypothetical protein